MTLFIITYCLLKYPPMDCDESELQNDMEIETDQKHDEDPPAIYLPGRSRPLEEDEELVMDKSAYRLYYQLQVEAPSLSFDVLLDCLGESREVEVNGGDPVTAYIVAGTQAATSDKNSLIVMRMANMKPMNSKVKHISVIITSTLFLVGIERGRRKRGFIIGLRRIGQWWWRPRQSSHRGSR